jgi:hypothetical protein
MYDIPYDRGAYIFGAHLPQHYSATEKSPCQTAMEKVIDSFTIVVENDTTVVCPLARMQGDAAVGSLPPYEVWYDPCIWLPVNDSMEPGLMYKDNPNCFLALQGEALGATPISQVQAAGIEWTLYRGDSRTLYYSFTFQDGGYVVRLNLPQPFDETAPTSCQRMSEDIIDTFALVQE